MSQLAQPATVVSNPLVHFGREVCGDLPAALRREWIVTNGLGGYASGTLAGVSTRSYHGLLVAALNPPVDRTVLVGSMVEWATYDGKRYPLSTHEYGDGTVDPQGYKYLQSFALEGMLPVWIFAVADALLERRVWMAQGANTAYVSYRLLRGSGDLHLEMTPLITYRGFHSLSSGQGWQPGVEAGARQTIIRAFEGAVPYAVLANGGQFAPDGRWWWNFRYRAETERGLQDRGDLYAPGLFSVALKPGTPAYTLTLTAEMSEHGLDGDVAVAAARERQLQLLRAAGVEDAHPVVQQLTLAADQFIVRRGSARPVNPVETRLGEGGQDQGHMPILQAPQQNMTVIAGYHWFNDWGRDTMIALRGLTLATGRPEDMANILRSFAQYVADGLLPNNFPDQSGQIPGYNTADATLWYVVALHAYSETTSDRTLVDELLPVVRDIVAWHMRGTRYAIGVDRADGLLHAGEPGVQLTWMDAKVGDLVVTPRIGKPVEINALWYNTLRILAAFLTARGDSAAGEFMAQAERVRESFLRRFRRQDKPGLADVVDGPGGDDWTLRPNQIFAVSLPFPLLEGADAAAVVDEVGRTLLTSYGLRSLSPDDPAYRGTYGGDQYQRDTAYHQGPVWTWLMGAYAEAHDQVYHDPVAALALLLPFEDHLRDAGLGTISEILEGDPPHLPRGCIAQAWGVAEVLRMWRRLENEVRAATVSPATTAAASAFQRPER
ncbi:MAG: amylo-alpha-1,6-glucosidase [Ktedonobacterales bacterium]